MEGTVLYLMLEGYNGKTHKYEAKQNTFSDLTNRWREYQKRHPCSILKVMIYIAKIHEPYHYDINLGVNTEDGNPSTDIYKLGEKYNLKGGDEEKQDEKNTH